MLDVLNTLGSGWAAGAAVAALGLPLIARPRTPDDWQQLGLAVLLWPATLVMIARAYLLGEL